MPIDQATIARLRDLIEMRRLLSIEQYNHFRLWRAKVAAFIEHDGPALLAAAEQGILAAEIDKAIAEAREEGGVEHERLLAHAREVRGSRDVHSVYEVLDWQSEQLAAKEAEAAVYRDVLTDLLSWVRGDGIHQFPWATGAEMFAHIEGVLSAPNAGADLLARLRAAEDRAAKLAETVEWLEKEYDARLEYLLQIAKEVGSGQGNEVYNHAATLAAIRAAEEKAAALEVQVTDLLGDVVRDAAASQGTRAKEPE